MGEGYMNILEYERKLNNVITMAPLECGVQTLVYQLLDDLVTSKNTVL